MKTAKRIRPLVVALLVAFAVAGLSGSGELSAKQKSMPVNCSYCISQNPIIPCPSGVTQKEYGECRKKQEEAIRKRNECFQKCQSKKPPTKNL